MSTSGKYHFVPAGISKKKKKINKWVYEFHSVSETDIKDFAKSLGIKTSIAPYNQ